MAKSLSKRKKRILLIILTALYILLQGVSECFTHHHLYWPNGIIMAFQFAICFFIVVLDYKIGRYISQICLILSLLIFFKVILVIRNVAATPGLLSTIVYFFTITFLSIQFEKRDKENISDYLTGLLNQRGLFRALNRKMESKKPFFLLGIHCKNYEAITTNYGYSFGEILLKEMSEDIKGVLNGKGVIAIIKGNDFYIVMDGDVYATGLAFAIINKLTEKKVITYNENETDIYLDVHAGFSKFPDDAQTPDLLLKYSDIATYHAEKENKKISHFEPSMEETVIQQIRIEKLIKSSIQNDFFFLVYQPQYTLDGKKLRGFETLLRMNAPHGDGVGPAEFIPVAERSDLILKIDEYVLNRAMNEFVDIVTTKNKDLTISINVSAQNVGNPEFPSKVLSILNKTKFPPENLEIEITEYSLFNSVELAIENISELRKLGIKVALDDFGTGYTSLSYLSKLPVNLLKVDKSFIDVIEDNPKNLEFVNTIISLGHLMKCDVISEGVENEKQLALLKEINCDLIQGYVWGKPLTYQAARSLAIENIDQGYLPFDNN